MFWNFCIAQGLFFPQTYHVLQTIEPSMVVSPSDYIDLTEEDHIKAGYDKIKKPWTEEEDKKLTKLRDQKGYQWQDIAAHLPGRNAKMCYSRYKRLEYRPREHWRPAEDELLKKLVEQHGQDWHLIVPRFKNRTPKQVKDHYINYLKFDISREHWTLEEDMKLVELLNKYGRNWKDIEDRLDGRTQNQIKNRFFGRIKKLQERKQRLKEEQQNQN